MISLASALKSFKFVVIPISFSITSTALLVSYHLHPQGADILAYADEHHKFQVFVPDMFQAEPAAIEWYPPEETGRGKELMEWFGRKASPEENATKIIPLVNAITIRSEGVIHKWAALGMCWGGKIVALTSGIGTPFTAVSEVHPGLVDPADAARVVVPMCVLASKDENAEKIKQFVQALRVEKHVETFHDQVHGWMAARADLADKRVREEFRRGYQTVLNFFVRYL
ncbi:MAG: hypothetical protein LQ351_001841 [Letrouitia transgressa]|nr:MAG: hypothetical protein LQ351_001841 [Letrouitia transgressa]